MSDFIWSLSQLQQLMSHSEESVPRWALRTWFRLFPDAAEAHLVQFLDDPRGAVVEETLAQLGRQPRAELIPQLRTLYLERADAVSPTAIRVLGQWQVAEAVAWMRERILRDEPLTEGQILGMIHALGQIPTADAYSLLKQTEQSIQNKKIQYWEFFYGSLLNHRYSEDIEAILATLLDGAKAQQQRRGALGLLLALVDQSLNPNDVFFVNKQATEKHLLRRLQGFRHELGGPRFAELTASISDSVGLFQQDAIASISGSLERRYAEVAGDAFPLYERQILQGTLRALKSLPASAETDLSETVFGLICLACTALIAGLEAQMLGRPELDAHWRANLDYLLRSRPPESADDARLARVIREADHGELLDRLIGALEEDPGGWGALRSVEMIGELKASQALPSLMKTMAHCREELFRERLRSALVKIGAPAVPNMMALLDSTRLDEQLFAAAVLADLPTPEAVARLAARFAALYAVNPTLTLNAVYQAGTRDFLPLVEAEYRPGEVVLGKVYLHLCRVNRIDPEQFKTIERDVKMGEELAEQHRRLLQPTAPAGSWPSAVSLELSCTECGKRYNYEVKEVHLHPAAEQERESGEDFTPHRHGVVLRDDLRCKNCQALNRMQLTPTTLAQISAESVKLLAFNRMGRKVPEYYPVKHVRWQDKAEQPITLSDSEEQHLQAVKAQPSRPATHLALGKFYEYVKRDGNARAAYLRAIDLDRQCLEAMAGLARLDHAAGRLREAFEWIDQCYQALDKGRFYLAEDTNAFKKMVRHTRKEFARQAGEKPREQPVEMRFHIDPVDYPRNKSCPCGSGKKYKLCCMRKNDQTG